MRPILRSWLLAAVGALALVAAMTAQPATPLPLLISGGDPTLAAETETVLRTAHEELVRLSGVAIPDTVRVVYVARSQSFDSVVGGRFPDWGVAAAVAEANLIAVRSPLDYPLGRSLRETLRHELAHLHIDALSGMRQIPRWMHEGYAQQFAHEWQFGDDALIARAVFMDNLIPLRDIDGVNSFAGSQAQLAYTQSYLAMDHFLQAYGWDGLVLFCRQVAERASWDEAFLYATGADYAAFQREFTESLRARYNWIAFLGDTILLWLGLVAVFVAIYVVKRRRAAKRRAEWEQQEAIEDILYGPLSRDDGPNPTPPPQP